MNETTDETRAALMRALSVAEQVTATAPVQPYDVVSASGTGVSLMLDRRPAHVAQVAAVHGLSVVLVARFDGRPQVETVGAVDGVPVRAWALGQVGEEAEYEAVVSPVGLPVAWSAGAA